MASHYMLSLSPLLFVIQAWTGPCLHPGGGEKVDRKVPLGTVTECKVCLVARSLKTEGNHALGEEGSVCSVIRALSAPRGSSTPLE